MDDRDLDEMWLAAESFVAAIMKAYPRASNKTVKIISDGAIEFVLEEEKPPTLERNTE
tara:strand:- start:806 stop:979 length:174 start_codon:yes stop_codon:yes gene_type:complete